MSDTDAFSVMARFEDLTVCLASDDIWNNLTCLQWISLWPNPVPVQKGGDLPDWPEARTGLGYKVSRLKVAEGSKKVPQKNAKTQSVNFASFMVLSRRGQRARWLFGRGAIIRRADQAAPVNRVIPRGAEVFGGRSHLCSDIGDVVFSG